LTKILLGLGTCLGFLAFPLFASSFTAHAAPAAKAFGELPVAYDAANSPVNVANQIKVPVFLAHGEQDENVFFNQFQRMKKALRKANIPAKYLAFENENHYLSDQRNREKFFIEVEQFLRNVNGESEYMKP
jgi:dipeptidyl aminopeptidase/acylaminoacyl peptidase